MQSAVGDRMGLMVVDLCANLLLERGGRVGLTVI